MINNVSHSFQDKCQNTPKALCDMVLTSFSNLFSMALLSGTDYLTNIYRFQLRANFSSHTKICSPNHATSISVSAFLLHSPCAWKDFPSLSPLLSQLTQCRSSSTSQGTSPSPLCSGMCAVHLLHFTLTLHHPLLLWKRSNEGFVLSDVVSSHLAGV